MTLRFEESHKNVTTTEQRNVRHFDMKDDNKMETIRDASRLWYFTELIAQKIDNNRLVHYHA